MSLWPTWLDFKKRATDKSRKRRPVTTSADATPEEEMAAAEESVEYWARVKNLTAHKDALMDIMTSDVVIATNRLFSPDSRPEQVHFDRGLLAYVFTLSSRVSRAPAELAAAQKRLDAIKEKQGVEIGTEADAG